MTQVPQLMELVRHAGLDHVGVIVGGIIPESDVSQLESIGVASTFGPGTPMPDIVNFLRERRQSA